MKIQITLIAVLISIVSFNLKAQQEMDSLSYSLGVLLGSQLKSQGFENLQTSDLAKGLEDIINGNDLAVDLPKAQQMVMEYSKKQQMKQHESTIKAGQEFLTNNAQKESVTELPSGLQYEVIEMGDGPTPAPTDQVEVHYKGTLLDGTVFDSSYKRGTPATFGVTQVIKGWTEALQLMPVGSKWKLYIPYDLAYGERGAGQQIGPYSTLVFEVELLAIK